MDAEDFELALTAIILLRRVRNLDQSLHQQFLHRSFSLYPGKILSYKHWYFFTTSVKFYLLLKVQ